MEFIKGREREDVLSRTLKKLSRRLKKEDI